jgi:hypothetical protein
MRWSLPSLLLLGACATGGSQVAAERVEQDTAVTAAREARDEAIRFLEVSGTQDLAAQSQLRAQAINTSTDLRAVASQSKREYARQLVLQRDAELQLARDRVRGASQERLQHDQQKVAVRTAETDHRRLVWDAQRRQAEFAKASMPYAAPEHLTPINPPQGGANEGPSAGFMEVPSHFPPP